MSTTKLNPATHQSLQAGFLASGVACFAFAYNSLPQGLYLHCRAPSILFRASAIFFVIYNGNKRAWMTSHTVRTLIAVIAPKIETDLIIIGIGLLS